jgi:hypothetical protein
MKNKIKTVATTILTTLILAIGIGMINQPATALASGGGGGGGGGVSTPTLSGNWIGSALVTTPTGFSGTTAFSLKLSVSGSNVSGSAHFGLPIFDATLRLTASTPDGVQFSGFVFNGEGSLPISGVMSADGKTITGTVIDGAALVTYTVTRN